MKKLILLILIGTAGIIFPVTSSAEETLLDNNFDLKTNRLIKDQTDDGKGQNFEIDDRLFNTEQMDQLDKAKKIDATKKAEKQNELFLTESPDMNDIDTEGLFAKSDGKVVGAKNEEAAKAVSSPPSFLPLILSVALVTVVTLVLYNTRRGKNHGREQRTH